MQSILKNPSLYILLKELNSREKKQKQAVNLAAKCCSEKFALLIAHAPRWDFPLNYYCKQANAQTEFKRRL